MRVDLAGAAFLAATFVSGCNEPMSEQSFAARRTAMMASEAGFRKEVSECAAKSRRDPKMVEAVALVLNMPAERAPETACQRLLQAVRDGRLSYVEYAEGSRGSGSPKIIRIAQGR